MLMKMVKLYGKTSNQGGSYFGLFLKADNDDDDDDDDEDDDDYDDDDGDGNDGDDDDDDEEESEATFAACLFAVKQKAFLRTKSA